jgi:hypothetical protein
VPLFLQDWSADYRLFSRDRFKADVFSGWFDEVELVSRYLQQITTNEPKLRKLNLEVELPYEPVLECWGVFLRN